MLVISIILLKPITLAISLTINIPVRVYVMGFFNLIKAISPDAPGEDAQVDVNTT